MQGIYTYIPEKNYFLKEYSVAAILLLLFMVLISLVSVLNIVCFCISTFRSMLQYPLWLFSGIYDYYYYHHPHHYIIIIPIAYSQQYYLVLKGVWLSLSRHFPFYSNSSVIQLPDVSTASYRNISESKSTAFI